MRLHFENVADLLEVDVLPPAEADDLVPRAEDLKVDADDIDLADGASATSAAEFGCDAGDERKGREVEEDVGLGVGDQDDVQVVERSVDKADSGRFDDRVFGLGRDETRERRQERLETWPREADKLTRQ